MALNHCELMGRITAPLELKATTNGKSVLAFTIAVDRGKNPTTGEKVTDFINLVAWENIAEMIARFFDKGRMICVEGSIQTRSYKTDEGKNRYITEIKVDKVHFTGEKAENTTQAKNESQNNDIDNFIPIDAIDLTFN